MRATREELLSKNIWLWGAGDKGIGAMHIIMMKGGRVKGLIDNSAKLQGKSIDGILVFRPEDIYEEIQADDLVVCCCSEENNKSIMLQLKENNFFENVREFDWDVFKGMLTNSFFGDFWDEGYEERMISKCCRMKDFEQEYFKRIAGELGYDTEWKQYHRKLWEFVYICKVLEDAGMLRPGKRGMGFAVGEEPLPSYFASKHVEVLATDLGTDEEVVKIWANNNQNAGGDIEKLYKSEICARKEFDQYVSYRDVDMNNIPEDIGTYDFCWSSCAIEHVGSLALSKEFLKTMLKVLKPGGIAVHTTEINLWSNESTIEEGLSVVYRRKDLEEIAEWCKEQGHQITLSFKRGELTQGDMYIDVRPYTSMGWESKYHICLMVGSHASTSYGIVIRKAE